ncbi:arachidonate 15-lipoxygenase B-like isoform X1 [Coturnix japonica]|uniref:arachidonate 15-lipoxygenase B-like isoform X1 n=2 Tax=Coturnix japonica TaxID=93934 RepID=UPI00077802D4|nr:arachidonate 15-lipoxygenase B-like isoform X1 [Coturnix japonica]
MPNTPGTLRLPPPDPKDPVSPETFLATLPTPMATGALLALLSVVSYEVGDRRTLGHYPERHFTEAAPRRLMTHFRRRLQRLSRHIRNRNKNLPLPYPYLDPGSVENSIST